MSRHRRCRGNNIEYSECDSNSGSFTDDDYGISPNTRALYMYDEQRSGNSRDISNFICSPNSPGVGANLNISDQDFPDQDDGVFHLDSMKVTLNIGDTLQSVQLKPGDMEAAEKVTVPKPADMKSQLRVQVNEMSPVELAAKQEVPHPTMEKLKEAASDSRSSSRERNRAKNAVVRGPYDPSLVLEAHERQRQQQEKKEPTREQVSLIVVGHVDAGKSTLMGNLLCQLHYVSEKRLARYKHEAQKAGKASFAFAWVLDESTEERERGVTTDVAQTYFETPHRKIQLLDAPGHKDFIPSMIGGAAQADAAILVVNASRGEFETGFESSGGGQTREHTRLIRVLGVTQVIVAVNKMDAVNYEEARFLEIRDQLDRFLRSLKLKAQFCPVSGLLGCNMTKPAPSADSPMSWASKYGPPLVTLIDSLDSPTRALDRPLRVVISEVPKPGQLTGRIDAGGLSSLPGALSRVLCLPVGLPATVKSIRLGCGVADDAGTSSDLTVSHAFDGDHVQLTMTGLDAVNIEPGSVLCHPEYPVPCTNRFRARLLIFGLRPNRSITLNFCVTLYYQQLSIPVLFERLLSVTTGGVERKKPRAITAGNCSALVDLRLPDRDICIESSDSSKRLSKFTLRDDGTTLAGGTVVQVLPIRR